MNMKIIAQIFVIIMLLTSAIPLVCAQAQFKADLNVTSNVASDVATFGAAEDATEDFDLKYDEPQPPIGPVYTYIRAYFYYPNSTYTPPGPPATATSSIFTELTTSYIALGNILEWPLKVDYRNATVGFTNITIAWNLSEVPEEYLVSLYTEGEVINMRESSSYTVNTSKSSESYEFNITAAKKMISPIITNITVTNITNNSATVTWDTNEISDSLVKYGIESGNYTHQEYNSTNVISHSLSLTNLSAGVKYYYVVNSTNLSGSSNQGIEYDFTTKIPLVLDTGKPANPYPSIFGTHNGTIKPNQTIEVSTLYTYPCAGTGGHTEYAMIWNKTIGECAVAEWNGYIGDYHNISFNKTLTLNEGVIYNYTIRTGSYPQIIHETPFNATGGTITCDKFIDANGKVYCDWIPAIKLWI